MEETEMEDIWKGETKEKTGDGDRDGRQGGIGERG